jgi:hypothetical protein
MVTVPYRRRRQSIRDPFRGANIAFADIPLIHEADGKILAIPDSKDVALFRAD